MTINILTKQIVGEDANNGDLGMLFNEMPLLASSPTAVSRFTFIGHNLRYLKECQLEASDFLPAGLWIRIGHITFPAGT